MIGARIRIALAGLLVLSPMTVACHKTASVRTNGGPVVKDTIPANVLAAEGRIFQLQESGQREAFRATLRKERELWQARKTRDYRFLLRVACFCPGMRGWLLIEVRDGRPVRASDSAGKSVAITDWNTFSIDGLYDNLERSVDGSREVRIAFDPRLHFPTYVRTTALPGPDAWSIVEVREFRPI
jgi:hypothetical protein